MALARAGKAANSASRSTGTKRIGGTVGAPTLLKPPPEPQEMALVSAGLAALQDGPMPQRFDFLVLGGGVAGLSFALEAAQRGSVAVLTKRSRSESNTMYAQGGVAAVLSERDSFEQHVADTVDAGAGLNNPQAVEVTVHEEIGRAHV